MSRTKREILDTENMLQRLGNLLAAHAGDNWSGCYADAESLRRISMTLHRWHELECGDSNDHNSWTIARGRWRTFIPEAGKPVRTFEYDDNEKPFLEIHPHHATNAAPVRYTRIPDREAGARKRLAAILSRYPYLTAYVQTDPRGCALYILKPGDVPEGEDVSAYYSRGLAVFQ